MRVEMAAAPKRAQEFSELPLDALIDLHIEQLTAYQGSKLAAMYKNAVTSLTSQALQKSAAKALYKALAYKDEYEVARLMLADNNCTSPGGQSLVGKVKRSYYLAPPLLGRRNPNTGHPQKIKISGHVAEPVFGILRMLKFLRGGPLDIFGYTQERRLERALAQECLSMVHAMAACGDAIDTPAAVADLNLILDIKGFGHVKHKNWKRIEPQWIAAKTRWGISTV